MEELGVLGDIGRKEDVSEDDYPDEGDTKNETYDATPFAMNNFVEALTNQGETEKTWKNKDHVEKSWIGS